MGDGFGTRLRELRQRAGLTQQKLATRARLSVSAIARLESGGRPKAMTAATLARILGVPVAVLLGQATDDGSPPAAATA